MKFIKLFEDHNNYILVIDNKYPHAKLFDNGAFLASSGISEVVKDKNRNKVLLWGFSVKDEYQNKGIGKILMSKVIDDLKLRGVEVVELSVMEKNTPAVKLYKSFGFEISKDTGHGVLYMCKNL